MLLLKIAFLGILENAEKVNKDAMEEMEKYLNSFEYRYDKFLDENIETIKTIYQEDKLETYSNTLGGKSINDFNCIVS